MKINEPYFCYSIGTKIKNIRLASDISLEKLSEISGFTVKKLIEIEEGSISIQIEEFLKIAKSLNIKASTLIEGFE